MTYHPPAWLWHLIALSKGLAFLYLCALMGLRLYEASEILAVQWGWL